MSPQRVPMGRPSRGVNPHRCIDGSAMIDSGNGRTIAQMTRDKLEFIDGLSQYCGSLMRYKIVTGTVKTIFADVVTGIENVRDRIHECLVRHRLMECGVEDCDLGNLG